MNRLVLMTDQRLQPVRWITVQQAARYYFKSQVIWESSSFIHEFCSGTSKTTQQETLLPISSIIALSGHRPLSSKRPPPFGAHSRFLFTRDLFTCAYCGQRFPMHELSRDHIHPVSKGGANEWTNLITSCIPCNFKKADKTLEESGLTLLYDPYQPNLEESLILKNRNILEDQKEFLLQFVPSHSRLLKRWKKQIT